LPSGSGRGQAGRGGVEEARGPEEEEEEDDESAAMVGEGTTSVERRGEEWSSRLGMETRGCRRRARLDRDLAEQVGRMAERRREGREGKESRGRRGWR